MAENISRRGFLQLCGISLAGLAFCPFEDQSSPDLTGLDPGRFPLGRVTKRQVGVYTEPDERSSCVHLVKRDTLLQLQQEILSPNSAKLNPRWYRISDGFVHSAYIQKIPEAHFNTPRKDIPESGVLGEVTVPFTKTRYKTRSGTWMELYRLYFGSVHWITGLLDVKEGGPWYRLTDERLHIHYYAPAWAIRPVDPIELTPLSSFVPDYLKLLEVSIASQHLVAYEDGQVVFEAPISSGRRFMETPQGKFQVERKYPSRHMGDGGITNVVQAYELVGVPWVTFFHPAGIAFHGTFWHDNFGFPMSQGCVNLRNEDAKWVFRWCNPFYNSVVTNRKDWKLLGKGTQVVVV